MERKKVFTVSQINAYIKQIFDKDLLLSYIYVKGEISNLTLHSSGHMYFTLKDKSSSIRCVMFKSSSSKIKFKAEEGLQVIVRGYFSIYERNGQYQLYAENIILEGTGELYKSYEQLKKQLEEEGLFDKSKKQALPAYPKNIAIVTSPTGAAVRDIISIVKRRNPNINITLYPVLVQGENASSEISQGIIHINKLKNFDAIIVGRGGGSIEELWAFNEESVARAIFNSQIPVVSAVGHETDFTIADFVADIRAATPSAAAELIAPEKQLLRFHLKKIDSQINLGILSYIKDKRVKLDNISKSRTFRNVETNIINLMQTLESFKNRLDNGIKTRINQNKEILGLNMEKLNILNPSSLLSKGYAFVIKEKNGELINSIKQLAPGERIRVYFKDGSVGALVESEYKGG